MTTDTQKNHSDRTIIIAGFHGAIFVYLFLLLPFVAAQSGTPPPIDDPYGFNAKFSPSTAVIIVVLITAFLFMGFFSIYIRQCAEDPNSGSIRPGILGGGRSRRGPRGLDPAVIETFPTFAYSVVKGLKIGKGTLECAVCLNEFEDDETLRLLPKCDHVFHPECIDLWLATHTTCPVCRANLAAEAGEVAVNSTESAPIPDSGGGLDQSPDIGNTQNQVSVRVIDDQNREMPAPDVINPNHIPIQNRPARSGSRSTRPRFTGKFPRSHSTGHSLVQPGENCERFTLRLPEDVRKQIVNGKLNRTTSCLAFPTEGSSRRGYRSSGEGSSRGKNYRFARVDSLAVKSDRWMFSMTPPFLSRTHSARSPKVAAEGDASTSSAKAFFTSVKTPFDCLGTKNDGAEQSSTRPAV